MSERDMRRLAEEVATCVTLTIPKEIEVALSEDELTDLLGDISDLVYRAQVQALFRRSLDAPTS